MQRRCLFFCLFFVCAFWGAAASAKAASRTFDLLEPAELDRVSRVTLAYYQCVTGKMDAVSGLESGSADRIFATHPPYIYMARQQCRISLLNVEKELYGLLLNPEFINNYTATLREDVVHFSLQHALRKMTEAKTEAARKEEWEKSVEKPREGSSDSAKPGRKGLGILAPLLKPEPEKR